MFFEEAAIVWWKTEQIIFIPKKNWKLIRLRRQSLLQILNELYIYVGPSNVSRAAEPPPPSDNYEHSIFLYFTHSRSVFHSSSNLVPYSTVLHPDFPLFLWKNCAKLRRFLKKLSTHFSRRRPEATKFEFFQPPSPRKNKKRSTFFSQCRIIKASAYISSWVTAQKWVHL